MAHLKCFISYSWDSDEHKAWVCILAEELQKNGIYVHLDQWDLKLGMNLTEYMETCIRECNYVLLICTSLFSKKANLGEGGVGYEKNIVTGEIFTNSSPNTKFVPVLREGNSKNSLPSYLKSKVFIDLRADSHFANGMEELLRHLHQVPKTFRPPLGPKPAFGRKDGDRLIKSEGESGKQNKKIERITSLKPADKVKSFDTELFKRLKSFAYGGSGLDMALPEAKKWAFAHLNDTPPFNIERFKELKSFAYGGSGLDMALPEAINWAINKLKEESEMPNKANSADAKGRAAD